MSMALPVADTPPPPSRLLAEYRPPAAGYDEMLDAACGVRTAWQPFVASVSEIDRNTLAGRWEQARRVIRENGVTYNVHGDPAGMSRPWELDPLPMLMSAAEWSRLSAGLAQRATLLNLVLEDLYGPHRLLSEGLLPPELVF